MIEIAAKITIKPDTAAGKKLKSIDIDEKIKESENNIKRAEIQCKEEMKVLKEKRSELMKEKRELNSKAKH